MAEPYSAGGGLFRPGPWSLPMVEDHGRAVPCWVHLEQLHPRPGPDQRRVIIDGLDWTGRVRGLRDRWLRTIDGVWLGVVTYELGYADGRHEWLLLREQLVPATALSRREDNKPLRGQYRW